MGKPAARLGDMTMHGGSIVVGFPTVLIGGMPAARVGDMHVCPMLNPGTPPPPHVGGPVALGSAGVLIGGMPAARMGDMLVCAGPPDTIALGCFTVLIGETGSGSASGGGGGTPASAAAQVSAHTALIDNLECSTKHEHWVEIQFVDKAGLPVSGIPYKFTDSARNESEAVLRLDGKIRRDALSAGQCTVQLFNVLNAKWSKTKADVGEKVKMTADVEGYPDGTAATFNIFRRDLKGADVIVATVEAKVQGKKVEGEWEFVYADDFPDTVYAQTKKYSSPHYYFEIAIVKSVVKSGMLGYKDWIEIELKDTYDNPIAQEEYVLVLPQGEVRKGKLGAGGKKREEKIPPGHCKVRFPKR